MVMSIYNTKGLNYPSKVGYANMQTCSSFWYTQSIKALLAEDLKCLHVSAWSVGSPSCPRSAKRTTQYLTVEGSRFFSPTWYQDISGKSKARKISRILWASASVPHPGRNTDYNRSACWILVVLGSRCTRWPLQRVRLRMVVLHFNLTIHWGMPEFAVSACLLVYGKKWQYLSQWQLKLPNQVTPWQLVGT